MVCIHYDIYFVTQGTKEWINPNEMKTRIEMVWFIEQSECSCDFCAVAMFHEQIWPVTNRVLSISKSFHDQKQRWLEFLHAVFRVVKFNLFSNSGLAKCALLMVAAVRYTANDINLSIMVFSSRKSRSKFGVVFFNFRGDFSAFVAVILRFNIHSKEEGKNAQKIIYMHLFSSAKFNDKSNFVSTMFFNLKFQSRNKWIFFLASLFAVHFFARSRFHCGKCCSLICLYLFASLLNRRVQYRQLYNDSPVCVAICS